MTRWIGVAMLALTLMSGNSAATAASVQAGVQKQQALKATDLSARRRVRHPAPYVYRPLVQPTYYDRPTYYRPYPYALPLPFFLGFGFGGW
jgi:hypothetical protein